MTTPLPDGTYDAFVIDAFEPVDRQGHQQVELTIIAGASKGMVITVVAATPLGDEIDLIGMPATITVADGTPQVVIDR